MEKEQKGRTWVAEKNKNITMSLIMYPNCKVEKLEGSYYRNSKANS